MKRYSILIPGWCYSMTCYGYNERDARARFKANKVGVFYIATH